MQTISFVIPGVPVPQERPRVTIQAGFPQIYDPPKSRAFKEHVRKVSGQEKIKQGWKPTERPLRAKLVFRLPIPTKFNKIKAQKAFDGEIRPTQKNDLDNLAKSVMDGMTGILYVDDAQIVSMAIEKYYGDPMILVKVEVLEDVDGSEKVVPCRSSKTRAENKTDPEGGKRVSGKVQRKSK